MDLGVSPQDMVVDHHMVEAEGLHPLRVGPDRSWIRPDLSLGKDDANLHKDLCTTAGKRRAP